MKIQHILTAFAFVAVLACCAKQAPESEGISVVNPNPPERRVEFLSFKASLENKYQTKTALDLDVTHKVIWNPDDEVLIEDAEGKSAVYKAVSGGRDTTTLVRVSGDTLNAGSSYKAWYPASYKAEGLPGVVYYDDPSTLHEAPMYAEGMAKLDFSSECGVVRFSYNPTENTIVKKIVFKASESLSSKDSVVMDITTNYPNGRTLYTTTGNVFPLIMMPGKYNSLNARFYNGNETVADVTLEYVLEVSAGSIADVDLNNPEGRISNLSKLGTANCYAITHAGEFSFSPTKGCSNIPIDGINSVEVLWETDNSTTALSSSVIENLQYADGVVSFSVPDNYAPANVLIGAKNADGGILWSWHLWICDGAISNQQYGSDSAPMILQDRSLGTLSAHAAKQTGANYGVMLYQWGRKDPFPGCTVNATSGLRDLSELLGVQRSAADGPVSIDEATANPCVFYKDASDWLSEPSDTLWAADHKTIFDPCPVGYRLPPMSAFSDQDGEFYKAWAAGNLYNSSGIYGGKNSFNSDFYGYPLTNMFPGSTYVMTAGPASHHIIWTTDLSGTDQPLCARFLWSNKKVTLETNVPYKKSDAVSVRCMLIQE